MIIRVKSHKGREKMLSRISRKVEWLYSFEDSNNFCEVSEEEWESIKDIKGLSKARPKGDLLKCWT
jgi:hypothetical protein